MSLYIYVVDANMRDKYREYLKIRRSTDSGMDILSPDVELDFSSRSYGQEIRLGIHCAVSPAAPYLLLVRSSTSLTPLRLSNNVGLADQGYRGELIARVDCVDRNVARFHLEEGRRLFQIVQHNWLPWKDVIIVDSLDELPAAPDNRGSGGFGSTGK